MRWYTVTSVSAVRLYLLPANFVLHHSLTVYRLRKRPQWSQVAWIEHIEDIHWKRCFLPDFRQFTHIKKICSGPWSSTFIKSWNWKTGTKFSFRLFFSSTAFNSRQKGYHFTVCILPLSRSKRCVNVLLCISPLTGRTKGQKKLDFEHHQSPFNTYIVFSRNILFFFF